MPESALIYIDVKHVGNQMTGVVLWKERDGKIVTKWRKLVRADLVQEQE